MWLRSTTSKRPMVVTSCVITLRTYSGNAEEREKTGLVTPSTASRGLAAASAPPAPWASVGSAAAPAIGHSSDHMSTTTTTFLRALTLLPSDTLDASLRRRAAGLISEFDCNDHTESCQLMSKKGKAAVQVNRFQKNRLHPARAAVPARKAVPARHAVPARRAVPAPDALPMELRSRNRAGLSLSARRYACCAGKP